MASLGGHDEVVKLLLDKGADVNAKPGLYQLNLNLKTESLIGNASSSVISTKAGMFIGGETDFDVAFSESSAGQTSLSVANTGNNPAQSVSVKIPQQETTGLPERCTYGSMPPYTELSSYDKARMIQICWAVYCDKKLEKICNYYIKPNGFKINNSHIHGITDNICYQKGKKINDVLTELIKDISQVDYIVGHNISFDKNIICSELYRSKFYKIIDMIHEKRIDMYNGKKYSIKSRWYIES
jgi:DNA polymerase III epsilon subunit-like protein